MPIRRKLRFRSSPKRASLGATLVEAAFSMLFFVVAILAMIEIVRYGAAYVLLAYAAHTGADLASKLEMEINTSPAACQAPAMGTSESGATRCQRYRDRVTNILKQVETLADRASVAMPSDGSVRRRRFQMYYDPLQVINGESSSAPIIASAALLRPGEKALRVDGDGTSFFDHPHRNFPGWPGDNETWSSVLGGEPLVIRIEAEFKPLIPLFGKIPMTIEAYSYRVPGATGRPGHPHISYGFLTPSPTPSPIPPLNPTASPTASGTRTATPTPDPNCLCCTNSGIPCPNGVSRDDQCAPGSGCNFTGGG